MAKMRAVQVSKAGGPFEMVEREIPEPGPRQVRVKVQACGLCHSDSLTKEGHWPGIVYPRVPGHEIGGVIDAVGSEVPRWKPGDRVGVGWLGSYCGHCESCRRGRFITCANQGVTGITMDGGYQDYLLVPFQGLALIPDEISPVDAGPLMCAGITTFNALRNTSARAGDRVAVLGIGGLGHLAVQFSSKMGPRARTMVVLQRLCMLREGSDLPGDRRSRHGRKGPAPMTRRERNHRQLQSGRRVTCLAGISAQFGLSQIRMAL